LYIQTNDIEFLLKFCFDPIHDGLHGHAGHSILTLKFKQNRPSAPDLGLYFLSFIERTAAGVVDPVYRYQHKQQDEAQNQAGDGYSGA
jgi:hypothetical protein